MACDNVSGGGKGDVEDKVNKYERKKLGTDYRYHWERHLLLSDWMSPPPPKELMLERMRGEQGPTSRQLKGSSHETSARSIILAICAPKW